MEFTPEDPPPRAKPTGRRSRLQDAIDAAKATPGQWYRLEGEHFASAITTLKGHGISVRTKTGEAPHKHILWICSQPVETEGSAS